jgi:hypothetical protein
LKVAICGSAPSSLQLAPFEDPSWQIWGCSPGAAANVRRATVWFEIHRWGQEWLTDSYRQFVAKVPTVYMIEPVPEVPNSVAYPKDEILAEFGPHFFSSTPAWMLALAIKQHAEEIGIWGIDLAADGEYADQKPGVLHFIELAKARGIKVTVPSESDLLRPAPLYGFSEASPMMIKLLAREAELQRRLDHNLAQTDAMVREGMFLKGAIDDLKYVIRTWGQ